MKPSLSADDRVAPLEKQMTGEKVKQVGRLSSHDQSENIWGKIVRHSQRKQKLENPYQ